MSIANQVENENEVETEIPYITHRKQLDNEELGNLIMQRSALNKIPKLFIYDIVTSEKINLLNNKIVLKARNIKFMLVMIRGTIIDIIFKENKATFWVDDGTGAIACFIDENDDLDECKETLSESLPDIEEAYKNVPENNILKASLIIINAGRSRIRRYPSFIDIKIGDTVEIIGKVKEYKNNKYCFVHCILKDLYNNIDDYTKFLSTIKHLYDNVYNQEIKDNIS